MGKVKQRGKMGEKGDSGGGIVGKSEGGWVLCKDGKYRVDPKWVGGSQCVQPSLDILPTPVIAVAKTDIFDVKAAPASPKVKKVKSKVTKVSSGSSKVYEKQVRQVGGLARTRAKMENDGYGLFPVDFNTEYRTSGDPTFKAATENLEPGKNKKMFKLHKTKTYEFLGPDYKVVTWEALQLAKTRSSSSSQGDSKTPIQVSLKDGKTGSILPDAPVPQYNSKMSKARKEELKCQKVAFNDKATYLKSWPEKQPRTGKSKCGFWGRRGSKREKAKQEVKEVASKKEVKSAKREVWWEEGWRKRKEEKVRLAEEEKARERKMHLRLVSPLDLDAQVLMMILMIVMDMTMMMMITIIK